MRAEQSRPPFWLWPNLVSLDAPLVAVLWQGFLAYRFSVPLRPAGRAVLSLTVWAIYLADRLLDARKPLSAKEASDEPARHRFYRRHSQPMVALLALVLVADAWIALFSLRPAILREGLIPLTGVLIYLAIFHLFWKWIAIPKEIAAAGLFTAGIFLTSWATLPCPSLAWAALAFFILCLANMIAIEAWEWRELPTAGPHPVPHPCTRWLAKTYLYWVPMVAIVCALLGRNGWYNSIALSAAACAVLFWLGRRLSLEARRALVDGVLLSPVLFLILK